LTEPINSRIVGKQEVIQKGFDEVDRISNEKSASLQEIKH